MVGRASLMIVRKPPFGSYDSWEAFRLALSFYAEQEPVSLVLQGQGVLNWVSNLLPETSSPRSVSRFVRDLEKFGVPVYVVLEDLKEAGLSSDDLASPYAKPVRRSELARMIASAGSVVAI